MIDYDIVYLVRDDTVLLSVNDEYIKIPRKTFLRDVYALLNAGMSERFTDYEGKDRWMMGMSE